MTPVKKLDCWTPCHVQNSLILFFLSAFWGPLHRVTIQVGPNLPLTSKQKFRFGLAWPGLVRPKRNFCFEVNGRFGPTGMVTLFTPTTADVISACSPEKKGWDESVTYGPTARSNFRELVPSSSAASSTFTLPNFLFNILSEPELSDYGPSISDLHSLIQPLSVFLNYEYRVTHHIVQNLPLTAQAKAELLF